MGNVRVFTAVLVLECFNKECHVCINQFTCLSSVLILCFIQDRVVLGETFLVMRHHIRLAVALNLLLSIVFGDSPSW